MRKCLQLLFVLSLWLMAGCAAPEKRTEVNFIPKQVQPMFPHEGFAKAGGTVLFSQSGREAEGLQMSKGTVAAMPGTLGIEFHFTMQKSLLVLEYESDEYLYYVAPTAAVSAYSGGAIVFGSKDEAGVRVSKKSGRREWYIDNSRFNNRPRGTMIWSRPIDETDDVTFSKVKVVVPVNDGTTRYITYDGYADHILRFKFREEDLDHVITKRYAFKKEEDHPVFVQINGAELEVMDASDEGIQFKSLKGFN